MFLIRSVIAAASRTGAAAFSFQSPGRLVDEELELIEPAPQWIDSVMAACRHARIHDGDGEQIHLTREQVVQFLQSAPRGHEPGDLAHDRAPTYHFWMLLHQGNATMPVAGSISLRVGHGDDLELYFGHIGYGVYPHARGNHYAERACRLLLPLARAHGLCPLWVTTDPDNVASRRTCERLGATMVNIVDIPPTHILYERGQRRKCRYRIDL